jgi:hypothetical protein
VVGYLRSRFKLVVLSLPHRVEVLTEFTGYSLFKVALSTRCFFVCKGVLHRIRR